MKIKRISIYQEFQCVGADCPVSCCKGWRIPIDNKAYIKYLNEKGLFGTRLRCSIMKRDGVTSFRGSLGRCPFWGTDHLCTIQKKHGTDYMPLVCVQFPRQLYNLGFFCEETLYLACPEAARLFLVHARSGGHFGFETMDGTVCYEVNTTNDDEGFLNYMLTARDQLIQLLGSGCSFDSKSISGYGRDAQNACLSGVPLPSPLGYMDTGKPVTMDSTVLDKLFYNGFYHPSLRTLSPFLYKLCQKYIREFSMLTPAGADRKLAALKEGAYEKIPDLNLILNRYYEYYLQAEFLNIFEDYSFSKHLFFGMAKANMLLLFTALYAKNKKSVATEELARLIAIYERRAPQLEDGIKKLPFPIT